MREGPGNSLFICYPGYDREIELPCPKLSFYSVMRLLLQMEKKEPARCSVASPGTRGRVRLSTQQEQAGPSHQAGTSQMNFKETYEHYTQGGASTAGGSTEYGEDEGPYYSQVCRVLMVRRWAHQARCDIVMRT
jgi:hypothetical protein